MSSVFQPLWIVHTASTFRHPNVKKYPDNTCKLVIILLKANLVMHICLKTLNNAHLWLEQSCTIGYTYKAIVEVIHLDPIQKLKRWCVHLPACLFEKCLCLWRLANLPKDIVSVMVMYMRLVQSEECFID